MHTSLPRFIPLFLLLVLVAACSSRSPSEPDTPDTVPPHSSITLTIDYSSSPSESFTTPDIAMTFEGRDGIGYSLAASGKDADRQVLFRLGVYSPNPLQWPTAFPLVDSSNATHSYVSDLIYLDWRTDSQYASLGLCVQPTPNPITIRSVEGRLVTGDIAPVYLPRVSETPGATGGDCSDARQYARLSGTFQLVLPHPVEK